jgi:CheY-like chemotaxis protein
LRPAPVNLNHSVRNIIELARALGPDMMSSAQCGDSIPPVHVDASGLENALLNLVINARDAMPGGGSLTIATRLVTMEESPLIESGELKPGSYASILVSDTGAGMSSDTLERVFEPFFTTKPLGKGTGLGLAMVYGFIKQSGGAIRVDSEPGRGTTFTLYLPLAEADAIPVVAPVRLAATGSRKILVVDDEPALLEIAKTYLKTMGHTVYGAAEGAGALQIVRQHPDIDLMITDIIMPGALNGVDLAKQVRELLPAIRVVYTSGYTKDAMTDRGLPRVDGQLLGKPYRMAEFETAVNAALQ